MNLREWIESQPAPRGLLTRLQLQTGISYSTIHGASHGKKVTYETAVKLSEATGSKVSVASLCEGFEGGAAA